MNVTGQVWMALTDGERLAMIEFASKQNKLRWEKKKATAATVTR